MNLKFWQWDLWTYQSTIHNWKAMRETAEAERERNWKAMLEANAALVVMERQRDEERRTHLKLRKEILDLKGARAAVAQTVATAAPMTEGKLVECFAGAREHPLLVGVCQVVDESFDALGTFARGEKNTTRVTDMALGGQEALTALKANLFDYCARAAVAEQMVGAEEGK